MARFRMRGHPEAQARGNSRGHPYQRAARGRGIPPSRPEAVVGGISESAIHRLLSPNMHAPAVDNQTTVTGVDSAPPNGLPGAGFVAEASQHSTNALDLNLQIGQMPVGAVEQRSMMFRGREEMVYVLTDGESEEGDEDLHRDLDIIEEGDEDLHRDLDIIEERREELHLQLDLNEIIMDESIKEPGLELQLQQLSLNRNNDESMRERRLEQLQLLDLNVDISNEDHTGTHLTLERGDSSNIADHGLGEAAWKEVILLLINEHDKVVRLMNKAHEESEAELIEHHGDIVAEMRNSFEKQFESFKNHMWRIVAVDKYERERRTSVRYYNELKATKKVKVVALKTLAEFVLTMTAQQAALKSQVVINEVDVDETQGTMHPQARLLQLHVQAMEATAAAMAKAIQKILALQEYHKIQLQTAVDKVAYYDPETELAEQRASDLLLEFAMKVLNSPNDDMEGFFKGGIASSSGPMALYSPRLEIDFKTMADFDTVALEMGLAVRGDLAILDGKSDGPEYLVDTTMEPASEITQAPPTDIPHDAVIAECSSNDLEIGGTEEQLQRKRKRESEDLLDGEPEGESRRKRLPRKSVKPEKHTTEDQEVTRIVCNEEGILQIE